MAPGFALVLLAWVLFSLAMAKHQRPLLAREWLPTVVRSLRPFASGLLILALAVFIRAKGIGQGPVFWASALVLAGLAWVLLLTFASRAAVAVAVAIAVAAVLIVR